MRHRAFAVFDQKAVAYLPPFFMPEVGMATRAFGDMINDPGHMFGKHPEDFILYELGLFDDNQGMLEPFTGPELVVNGLSLLQEKPADAQKPLFEGVN